MMATFLAVMQTEMRLALRRRTFWVVQGIWLLPTVLILVLPTPSNGYVSNVMGQLLQLEWLLLPLLVGPPLTRDLHERGEVLWTTPLSALVHLLGVVSGLLLALLPALVGQLLARYLATLLVAPSIAWLLLWYGAPLLLAATLLGVSAAALLALLLRRTLLLLLVWVPLLLLLLQQSTGFFGSLESLALLSPANIFFFSLELSPALGLGPSRPLVVGLVVWFIGLSVLLALLALVVAVGGDRRRAVRERGIFVGWLLAALLLASGGWVFHSRAARAQAIVPSPMNIQLDGWEVTAHRLDVTVDAEAARLGGDSMLQLAPRATIEGAQVVLRLHPDLTLIEARDGADTELRWRRYGDSIMVTLPVPPTAPVTLHLRWQGTPQPAYSDYGQRYGFSAVSWDTPQPIRSLLADGVGYLLRDGDWYPWPWMSGPRQAADSRVTVMVTSGTALAPRPMQGDGMMWEGPLPAALLVLPPAGEARVAERTLHFGALGENDVELRTRIRQLAEHLPQFAEAMGEPALPSHVVALPYLNDYLWSGDLLLMPEGTGFLVPDQVGYLFYREAENSAVEERGLFMALARAWLAQHLAVPEEWARVLPASHGGAPVVGAVADEPGGRWVRPLAPLIYFLPDATESSRSQLAPFEQFDLLALWLAIELADPTVRAADLDLLLTLPESPTEPPPNPMAFIPRLLPANFPVMQVQKTTLLNALHEWAEQVGREHALYLFGEAVRAHEGVFNMDQLLDELEAASEVEIDRGDKDRAKLSAPLHLCVSAFWR